MVVKPETLDSNWNFAIFRKSYLPIVLKSNQCVCMFVFVCVCVCVRERERGTFFQYYSH